MAVTGVVLLLFIVAHMVGNLKIFTGERHFDEYGAFLRNIGSPVLGPSWYLWVQRAVLLGAVGLHIVAAYQLAVRSRAARPVRYVHTDTVAASYASRTMRWSGVIIGLFVIYHLLHFTTGAVHPDFEFEHPYHNVIVGFQVPYVALVYIAAVAALGLHLYHGIWSLCQTLGVRSTSERTLRRFAGIVGVTVFVGYASVPAAVLAGVLS